MNSESRTQGKALDTVPLPDGQSFEPVRVARRATLLVDRPGGAELFELRPGEPLVIGREPPSHVVVADRSLSRQHARFSWTDGEIVVEDLGSTNGTLVGGERITRRIVRPGEVILVGTVAIAVQDPSGGAPAGSRLEAHDAIAAAIELEVARARFWRRAASLVMLRLLDPASSPLARILSALRPVDRIARFSADTLEVLLPEMGAEEALSLAHALLDAAGGPERGRAAVATFPEAATTAEKLVAACRAAVRSATAEDPVRAAAADGATPRTLAVDPGEPGDPIVVNPAMRLLHRTLDRLARSTIPVLLHGETGTGKEVIARAIHVRGPRADAPILCVNCGAIPAQLVESTLFGHERGAFTGATQQHKGVFEAASGGTVLLDEIGELPPAAQAALLRVLEAKRVTRVGSTREIEVDVRVIAATHKDLEAMCERGEFRVDLLYRLNAMTLVIPPLRERPEEIGPLVDRFLVEASRANAAEVSRVSPEALSALRAYRWPGNVRELRNAIERAVVIADGPELTVADLPDRVRAARPLPGAPGRPSAPPPSAADAGPMDLKAQMSRHEARVLVDALRAAGWNQSEAARRLELPLRTLVHKIKAHGIKKLGYAVEDDA
jgi:DNA-binding NtrC family response regulator